MADPRSKPKQPRAKTAAPPPAAPKNMPPPQQPVRRQSGRGR